jgi:DNA (cytosine-5)-methyltransferase 1
VSASHGVYSQSRHCVQTQSPGILAYVIPIIDIFAGPGGLGEGFSAFLDGAGRHVFKIGLSIEKDPTAHQTLLLRSFFRQFDIVPGEYYSYVRGEITLEELFKAFPNQSARANEEAVCAELGKNDWDDIDSRIRRAIGKATNWVLIGGPPCQAYSLVGRSRMRKKNPQKFGKDTRHLLYREYLRILAIHQPPVFVMENVKGILSSKHKKEPIIDKILQDLKEPLRALPKLKSPTKNPVTYSIHSLVNCKGRLTKRDEERAPDEYVLRCEEHGIPQARHRVILVGIRTDITKRITALKRQKKKISVWRAIQDLPEIRSRISSKADSAESWARAIREISEELPSEGLDLKLRKFIKKMVGKIESRSNCGGEFVPKDCKPVWESEWFYDQRLGGVLNHTARGHIPADLRRYFFAACYARIRKRSPKIMEFPASLMPEHKNVKKKTSAEIIFADRFRVQMARRPATTVTSHISKDGHYFIHPDPLQTRSLTVREAARLQTFPDNYFFSGARTAQYHQVGNAVPPLIARKIASRVAKLFST